MKILCYGDSNTWGYIPNINGYTKSAIPMQYDKKLCWWYALKENNEVIIDGLCGRCICHENKWLTGRNASITIVDDLKKYKDVDLVIIQLGTNDCKSEYNDSPQQLTENLKNLLRIIKFSTNAQILIISPAQIKENNIITQRYYLGAQNKSLELDKLYAQMANKCGYNFVSGLDLEVGEDGEHLTIKGHQMLSLRVKKTIETNVVSK